MQNIVSKILLIVIIVGLCGLAMALKPFRLGSDLRGGTSLIYSVDIPEDANAQQVLAQVIEVLKNRVNPTGVLDISMQPLGLDRIEVVMPLPGDEVKALAKTYRDNLDRLLVMSEIRSVDLEQAVRDGTAIDQFCLDESSVRCKSIRDLQEAYDLREVARQNYRDAESQGLTGEEFFRIEQAAADTEDTYDDQLDKALDYSLDRARLVRSLSLPTTQKKRLDENGEEIIDSVTGEPVLQKSPRTVAVESIEGEFPHLTDQLTTTITAYDEYQSKRKGFDDPEDLMRLLRGAGVLEFHIAVQSGSPEGVNVVEMRAQLHDVGPDNTDSNVARWYSINELKQWYDTPQELASLQRDPGSYFQQRMNLIAEEFEGKYYLLIYTTDTKSLTHAHGETWSVDQAYPSQDQLGRQAVAFRLDPAGGSLMGRLTTPHVSQPMAILLDGQVYSAPTLQSAIAGSGIITGTFSQNEINYLIRVLAAGSLEARLSDDPIAINTLGPSLGQDNLDRGTGAFIYAIIAVAVFMLAYYFFAGLVADMALLINGVIIFGFMAAIDGTFTLPGLAGIVLTIGMAVDANVLIYERIREELFSDEWDLRGAIREGYRKALSTIIDANVTNLIVCFVLAQTATTEVKGFAVTLSIGICATLFTALFVTRQVYYLYTDLFGIEKLVMLPTAVPSIHRMLEPNINWLGLRKAFWALSIIAVIGSLTLVGSRGADMLDTEFRGGVSIMMRTRLIDPTDPRDDAERILLAHAIGEQSVLARAKAIGATHRDVPATLTGEDLIRELVLREFNNVSVVTVGATQIDATIGGLTANRFQIKIPSPKELTGGENLTNYVVDALVEEFGDQLDIVPALTFDGAGSTDYARFTLPITEGRLGGNIPGSDDDTNIQAYRGGVAVLLRSIDPPATIADLEQRIERMRRQSDFSDCIGRSVMVIGLEEVNDGSTESRYRDIAVVVYDKDINYNRSDADVVDTQLASREWELVNEALTNPSAMEQVSSFSSAVAQTMKAKAIVAVILTLLGILAYIWVRFGSLRYSLAAIVALIHDVIIALGILALTGYIGTSTLANFLLIEEFKINLGVVAALLTIIGYSLNDTIVILDRIRENRGKLPLPTASIVNRSINQTISRTVLTSVTTLLAVLIMFGEGGSGLRPFTFCLLIGLVVGTYSSVAIAAPLVFSGGEHADPEKETEAAVA